MTPLEDPPCQDCPLAIVDPGPSPREQIDKQFIQTVLLQYLTTYLTPREKEIILLWSGVTHEKPMARREIADKYHVTRNRIDQIFRKAIEKLQWPGRQKSLRRKIEDCYPQAQKGGKTMCAAPFFGSEKIHVPQESSKEKTTGQIVTCGQCQLLDRSHDLCTYHRILTYPGEPRCAHGFKPHQQTELSRILGSESEVCGQCEHFDGHNRCKRRNILVCIDTPRCRNDFDLRQDTPKSLNPAPPEAKPAPGRVERAAKNPRTSTRRAPKRTWGNSGMTSSPPKSSSPWPRS